MEILIVIRIIIIIRIINKIISININNNNNKQLTITIKITIIKKDTPKSVNIQIHYKEKEDYNSLLEN